MRKVNRIAHGDYRHPSPPPPDLLTRSNPFGHPLHVTTSQGEREDSIPKLFSGFCKNPLILEGNAFTLRH
jgi:hypothetical protein